MIEELINSDSLQHLQGFKRLIIGFSGGLDSTVLLHVLATQGVAFENLIAVHINHGLSGNAADWERHCQDFCQKHDVPLIVRKVTIDSSSNVEEEARKARYGVFRSLISEGDAILLAHHRDDQAETLLLQLFRGAGLDGLSAMLAVKEFSKATLIRPLLHCSRNTLQAYADAHQLSWVNDESNNDSGYSRNFLRNEIIPLLQTRWPGVLANLARSASHCHDAQLLLAELAEIDYPEGNEPRNTLSIASLVDVSYLRMSNILRNWLKKNAVRFPDTATFHRLIPEIIFASPDANPELAWGDYCIRRYRQTLYLLHSRDDSLTQSVEWISFPKPLTLLASSGFLIAKLADTGLLIPPESHIEVRFRQGGESIILRKQTKTLKKLFQEWQIPAWLRERIPLLYVNGQLAAIIGYAMSDNFYQASSTCAVFEISLVDSLPEIV